MTYQLYVDEVGNPDCGNCHNDNHHFLSLTGVIIDLNIVKSTVHPQMEKLKDDFFDHHPDEPLIFHRKDILNGKPPFEKLREKDNRLKFDNAFLELLKSWEYTVITVCIDKKNHKNSYGEWRYEPYHYCLEVLLERYLYFLDYLDKKGNVMAESRGKKEDKELMKVYSRLWENGGQHITAERFQKRFTSKNLKVNPKYKNISGLQLADIVAHPSRNEILNERGLLERNIAPFAESVIKILKDKYYAQNGNVYGKKLL